MDIVIGPHKDPRLTEDDLIPGRVYVTTGGGSALDECYYLFSQDGTLVGLADGWVERPNDTWRFTEVNAHLVIE